MSKHSGKSKPRNFLAMRTKDDVLELGRLVAETDDHLEQYYVASDSFLKRALDVRDPAVFFVGPKGIGKSAILQMVRLVKVSDSDRIINISPDDLAFSALTNVQATPSVMSESGRSQWLFKSLWDYILLLEILRREYPGKGAIERFLTGWMQGGFENEARRLIKFTDGSAASTLSSKLLQLIKEVELDLEVSGVKAGANVKIDQQKPVAASSLHLLTMVNNLVKEIKGSLKHVYYILIDDLDVYWDGTESQNAFVSALFVSLRHFGKSPHIKAAVALRQNIFDVLQLPDRDKFHDNVCRVEWSRDSVRKMIERRVEVKFKVTAAEVWGGFFPEGAFDAIWKQSFGRPREAIRVASLAVHCAAHEGHPSVQESDLTSAIRMFSDERIREVADETHLPGIEALLRKFGGGPREFSYEKLLEFLELRFLEVEMGEPGADRYAWVRGHQASPIGLMQIFLDHGFLLIKQSRTDEAKPFDKRSPIEITSERWFAIHPMFAAGLGLVGA